MSQDVGISPVLLQAISQSITATTRNPTNTTTMDSSNRSDPSQLPKQSISGSLSEKIEGQELDSEAVKTMLKIKMAANAISKTLMNEDGSLSISKGEEKSPLFASSTISDLAMANMLTALASQADHTTVVSSNGGIQSSVSEVQEPASSGDSSMIQHRLFASLKESDIAQQVVGDKNDNSNIFIRSGDFTVIKSETEPEPVYTSMETNIMNATIQAASDVTKSNVNINLEPSLAGVSPQSKFMIQSKSSDIYNPQSLTMTTQMTGQDQGNPGPTSIVMMGNQEESDSGVVNTVLVPHPNGQLIEYGGKRYILHASGISSSEEESPKYIAIRTSPGPSTSEDSDVYTTVAGHEVVAVSEPDTVGVPIMNVYAQGSGEAPKGSGCPICSDDISGFHYGIFTCESCKGFFKRTVQNKKSFVCHRQGECEITLENRKKCPACRFAKCLVMGMKLDAIRQDRSRGGRSSYSGLSPLDEAKRKRHMKTIQKRPSNPAPVGDSRLASVLSNTNQTLAKPFVPAVLTDIMNLESLLCDDDIPQNIKADDFISTNPSVFLTLLQLCELKLYKIVRWARNLPYFANISTDDQILLLQNCWCELLALTMCWKSIHLTNEIVFFHGQTIDIEKAKLLNLGEMFMCLLAEVEQLKRLKLDQYECVAMKVIILITPDIKGLNDSERLGLQQQKVSEALEQYTSRHYRQHPSKYGELLLRLPELSRISFMLKEQLLSWMPQDNTSCGLLFELLKGENMKELL